ncbi:hypothetical protein [Caulobacter zeae]|uniref:hypothetical protein n=1 Tax=Caulobacter zeae TaxID=2055137 RepID=UPI001054942B|nr:hypothetical protein [Caulobacter zeae]
MAHNYPDPDIPPMGNGRLWAWVGWVLVASCLAAGLVIAMAMAGHSSKWVLGGAGLVGVAVSAWWVQPWRY